MCSFLYDNVINSLYLQNVFVQKMKIIINIKNLSNLKKERNFLWKQKNKQ
jgi:hypothetical protein